MSEYELLELLQSHVEQIDSAFEYWMAATFAVIVAIHTTRETITLPLKIMMGVLYASLSLVAFLHTYGDIQQIVAYQALIETEGAGAIANGLAGLVRLALYLVGTVSVVIAIFKYENWVK